MEHLFSSEGLISLLTLTVLEIILGIDNIIFISIVSGKLPTELQAKARTLGILLALFVRIGLLFGITWIIGLKEPFFSLPFLGYLNIDTAFSGKDIILLGGGLFLIAKSTSEIHGKLEGEGEEDMPTLKKGGFALAVIQIILIDIVFSFDSILTAVGLVKEVLIMIIAVIIALIVMLIFSGAIARFVEEHPTIKMLALAFLVLIGFLLIIEGFGEHVPKGYIYFAMTFSFGVELLNMKLRKRALAKKLAMNSRAETPKGSPN